ncbi:hypothetical protein M427DRAFT_363005 [Gonapodya prolifera JEL478]|uniref:Uncharacterized protein n=1 Tax=Gonapodya prolifera (strain JEL478) TaxID=1344416 RepID=A0A139AAH1_GONPJ|nr:hypothetical protein M427DRAFT_363005 [Gonapodya prolifera JEL478]|eukprot:KXS13740.1 hypothetical protein M427DRAFT_363005 [Gonapodya prolifera JEL478]
MFGEWTCSPLSAAQEHKKNLRSISELACHPCTGSHANLLCIVSNFLDDRGPEGLVSKGRASPPTYTPPTSQRANRSAAVTSPHLALQRHSIWYAPTPANPRYPRENPRKPAKSFRPLIFLWVGLGLGEVSPGTSDSAMLSILNILLRSLSPFVSFSFVSS